MTNTKNKISILDLKELNIPEIQSQTIVFINNEYEEKLSSNKLKIINNKSDLTSEINNQSNDILHIIFIGTNETDITKNINIKISKNIDQKILITALSKNKSNISANINFEIYENAKLKTHLAYINDTESNYSININVEHKESKSESIIFAKGIIYKNSTSKINMQVSSPKELTEINGYELHKVLKLDSTAKIISNPNIICGTEQARINHGFSLSGFNNEDIFFLQSRGINTNDCKDILKQAFINEAYNI